MPLRQFGKNPSGRRLTRIESSGNFRNGAFQNIEHTEVTPENISYLKLLREFIHSVRHNKPPAPLPYIKTDLHNLETESPVIVWFGHSSYLIRYQGITILVDPVFCGHASPFSFFARSFPGSNSYSAEDMPAIDILLLTHDHYDHLDYETVRKLDSNVKKIVTSLGVGEHLEYWNIHPAKIHELNWDETFSMGDHFRITAAPARHFSGRGTKRGKTLWSSFIIEYPPYKIFAGGDSGYDNSFVQIGKRFGPFDLAILENGQYNQNWPNIHMMPEETVKAAGELGAEYLLPVHWGKFTLSLHAWNEPIIRLKQAATAAGQKICTPRIGQSFWLPDTGRFDDWWHLEW